MPELGQAGTTPADTTPSGLNPEPATGTSTVTTDELADPFAGLDLETEPFPEPNLSAAVKHPKDTDWEVATTNEPAPVINQPATDGDIILTVDETVEEPVVEPAVDSTLPSTEPVLDEVAVSETAGEPLPAASPATATLSGETTTTSEPDLTGLNLPWLMNDDGEEPWWMQMSEYSKAGTIMAVLALGGGGLLALLYAFGQAAANGGL